MLQIHFVCKITNVAVLINITHIYLIIACVIFFTGIDNLIMYNNIKKRPCLVFEMFE